MCAAPTKSLRHNRPAAREAGRGVAMTANDQGPKGAHLIWPSLRSQWPFQVRVVEPDSYDFKQHAAIFHSVLADLVNLTPPQLDGLTQQRAPSGPRRFDLITFPEAFIAPDTLAITLKSVKQAGLRGCVHVGLRSEGDHHLFTTNAVRKLVDDLSLLIDCPEDLDLFEAWLCEQDDDQYFNIGCVFMIDADHKVRLCLHPKLVRSRFEESVRPEDHMREANLLTLITLQPRNRIFGSVTLQPLICADALGGTNDCLTCAPMAAVTRYASAFEGDLPNHVDIVSLATCTPQPVEQTLNGEPYRLWHVDFLDAFRNAAKEDAYARHHHAALVLSNFLNTPNHREGGLSGIFLPMPPGFKDTLPGLSVCCWGRPTHGSGNNRWSTPDDQALTKWSSMGFVAGLNPYAESAKATARIFQFELPRLPREQSRWGHKESLVDLRVHLCVQDDHGDLVIQAGKNANA